MSFLLPLALLLGALLVWGITSVTSRSADTGAPMATLEFLFRFALIATPFAAIAALARP